MTANSFVQRPLPRAVVFLLLFLLGSLLICASRISYDVAGFIDFVWGAGLYWFFIRASLTARTSEPNRRLATIVAQVLQHAAVIVAIYLLSGPLVKVYYWITWDPIGDSYDSGLGWSPPWVPFSVDSVDELPAVPNGEGLVAIVRRTRPGLDVGDYVPYFVFVLAVGEKPNARDLVFRYQSTEAGIYSPPKISWLRKNRLSIAVESGNVFVITKQRFSIDDVAIRYKIGRTVRNSELNFWERPFPP
jgi:hypothetical protein